MTPQFRLPSDVLVGWKDALSKLRGAKGVDESLKGVLHALQTEDAEGHVIVSRHDLFSWSQALQGSVPAVAADMQSYLSRRTGPAPGPAPAPGPSPSPAPALAPAQAPSGAYRGPPPVVYQRAATPGAPSSSGASRFVAGADLGGFVREMLREAKGEVVLVSPWSAGLDSLVDALLALPPHVQVRALTRRPAQEDDAYHRGMMAFRKRGFDVAFSPHVQTRLVVTDGARLLLGAASVPSAVSREVAIATTDAATVNAARENALRLIEEAKAGR